MHGIIPDCENRAGSFPYLCNFACVTVSCAGGGWLVFLLSRGFLLSYPRAVMGTLAAVNGKPDTARYARRAAPGRRGADKLEVSFSCLLLVVLLLLASASSGRPRADRERAGDDYINQCQVWEL